MPIFIKVFILGVSLSWGPCLGFCAPILLPYIMATQEGWREGLKVGLAFSIARIVPYVVFSITSATIGQYVISRFYTTRGGFVIYLMGGIFICVLGIIILLGKTQYFHLKLPYKKESAKSGIKEMALLGMMVGFAPCVPLLGLFTFITFNARNVIHGALIGLVFSLGTLISPLILLAPFFGQGAKILLKLKKPLLYQILSRACGVILLYFGVQMVVQTLLPIFSNL